MTYENLCRMHAVDLAEMVRTKTVSPVELVEDSLRRIDAVNPELNCFCFVYPDEARQQAKEAEQAVSAGEPLGTLHGVPIAIKDLTPTKGRQTTMGSCVFENWIPEEDAVIVQNLENAGAIVVGKTTTPEFAYASTTDSVLWGITRNPWDPERTPGGSSGGSAVAVATGCVPIAEGSDAGGSVRIPAAHCGIVGLKPSFGRIPFEFMESQFDWMFCHGPLAKSIDDAALFLSICQGPNEADLQSLTTPVDATDIKIPDPSTVKLALSPDLGFYDVDKDVAANLAASASALSDAGCVVEVVDLGWTEEFLYAWWAHWDVFMATHFGQYLARHADRMHPLVVKAIENGFGMSAVEARRLEFVFTDAWKTLSPILQDFDALLCPTESFPAPSVLSGESENVSRTEDGRIRAMDMTMQFNALKLPAVSMPTGLSEAGLPTALQVVGRRNDDRRVLEIAKLYERICPWARLTCPW